MRVLLLALAGFLAATLSLAADAERPTGLMWNRSGLPLVFPLNVKSLPGRDYYMVLSHAETGEPVLAAFVRGGEFFRVLAPPSQYDVSFAAGADWQGEEELFGPSETETFALKESLIFAVVDDSTKGGHSIDLRDMGTDGTSEITVASTFICQGVLHRRTAIVAEIPDATVEDEPVGQQILERRFLRGQNVFDTYDRQRQQNDFDPTVLGRPQVPLNRPEAGRSAPQGVDVPNRRSRRVYERPC